MVNYYITNKKKIKMFEREKFIEFDLDDLNGLLDSLIETNKEYKKGLE